MKQSNATLKVLLTSLVISLTILEVLDKTDKSNHNPEQHSILLWRSNITEHRSVDMAICNHHLDEFVNTYERSKTKCCGVINQ